MRYAAEHKQQTRERVLAEAAKQIRAHGPRGVGVASIMKRAGLTHGGFYAHFRSKDALVAAAISKMFDNARARFLKETDGRETREALGAYIDFYLSTEHRDTRATGCPIPALASDLPRLPAACRAAYSAGVHALAKRVAAMVTELDRPDPEALASSVVAELVGALSLARVEPDAARSDAILANSRRALRARLALGGRS